jgi:hypothetical protein
MKSNLLKVLAALALVLSTTAIPSMGYAEGDGGDGLVGDAYDVAAQAAKAKNDSEDAIKDGRFDDALLLQQISDLLGDTAIDWLVELGDPD